MPAAERFSICLIPIVRSVLTMMFYYLYLISLWQPHTSKKHPDYHNGRGRYLNILNINNVPYRRLILFRKSNLTIKDTSDRKLFYPSPNRRISHHSVTNFKMAVINFLFKILWKSNKQALSLLLAWVWGIGAAMTVGNSQVRPTAG